MYIPSKPGKYGIKLWVCADVETSYSTNFQVYLGKEGHHSEIGQGSRVVLEMTQHLTGSGRNCTGDNFFTSLNLSRALLCRKITYIGTVGKTNQFLPPALKNIKGRELCSSVFAFEKDHCLVSYVPRKNRNVLVLSSQHKTADVDTDDGTKKHFLFENTITRKEPSILLMNWSVPISVLGNHVDSLLCFPIIF